MVVEFVVLFDHFHACGTFFIVLLLVTTAAVVVLVVIEFAVMFVLLN